MISVDKLLEKKLGFSSLDDPVTHSKLQQIAKTQDHQEPSNQDQKIRNLVASILLSALNNARGQFHDRELPPWCPAAKEAKRWLFSPNAVMYMQLLDIDPEAFQEKLDQAS
ncbi:hypothetical protein HAP94_24845 [Acidithiobacillus ferrivorans]|nr:hypothetical protein [Acidithiobacillus ferrivorans]